MKAAAHIVCWSSESSSRDRIEVEVEVEVEVVEMQHGRSIGSLDAKPSSGDDVQRKNAAVEGLQHSQSLLTRIDKFYVTK